MYTIAPHILVTDVSLIYGMQRFASTWLAKGKDVQYTLRTVMRYWVSFATDKIAKPNKAKIERDLMSLTRLASTTGQSGIGPKGKSKRGRKMADKYVGTVAAAVVMKTGYGGATRRMAAPEFYAIVNRYVQRRKFAAGVHRAGNLRAIKALRAKQPSTMPNYTRQPPGLYEETWRENLATLFAENWASAWGPNAQGVGGRYPEAFRAAIPQVERALMGFIYKDMLRTGQDAGFKTNGR